MPDGRYGHRRLVAGHWTQPAGPKPGRPAVTGEIRNLAIQLAGENSTWAYRRIHGALCRLGHNVAPSSVRKILYNTGITTNPTGDWTTQAARNFLMGVGNKFRFVIHDGAGQYTRAFNTVFDATGTTAITTPPQAPMANAYAQRRVRTLRHELLDRTIIWNERQLRALLTEYLHHYNQHRPHRALRRRAPNDADVVTIVSGRTIERHTTCGGLISEYRHAACTQQSLSHNAHPQSPPTSARPHTPHKKHTNSKKRSRRALEAYTARCSFTPSWLR